MYDLPSLLWVGTGKRSKGDVPQANSQISVNSRQKKFHCSLWNNESEMKIDVVDKVKQENFLSVFTIWHSTFSHLTILHCSYFLNPCWSCPGSHLHVKLVSIASWLSFQFWSLAYTWTMFWFLYSTNCVLIPHSLGLLKGHCFAWAREAELSCQRG